MIAKLSKVRSAACPGCESLSVRLNRTEGKLGPVNYFWTCRDCGLETDKALTIREAVGLVQWRTDAEDV